MIYFAPLQGFTDFIYRNAFTKCFTGVDKFFIPYISVKNNIILKKHLREVLPENNPQMSVVVPQVLAATSHELLFMANVLADYGYTEINLNLGCPYPMVTNRSKGAGLLPWPEKIKNLLTDFFEKSNQRLSVKMRAGLQNTEEIEHILPVLNSFPLTEVILHPRIASQLYEGNVNEPVFERASDVCCHPLIYNGNIFSLNDFQIKKANLTKTKGWMLGRGILMNPFLPEEITGLSLNDEQRKTRLFEFHHLIADGYLKQMDNPGNALNKMKQFWIYFSHQFTDQRKVLKRIKKTGTVRNYYAEVENIFGTWK